MSELKNCPFCGGRAEVFRQWSYAFDRNFYHVECVVGCVKQITPMSERETAIERWNRRA